MYSGHLLRKASCYRKQKTKLNIQKIIIASITIGLIGCLKKNNEIVIDGKIYGNLPTKVEYTVPVNGTWFYGAKKSVVPDSSGNFTIAVKSNASSFITFYIPKQAAGVLLVEPGKTYEIDFYLNAKDQKFEVKGTNSEALNLYNSFALPGFFVLSLSNKLLEDSVLTSVSSKIDTMEKGEIAQFREQLEKQAITKDFYNLVELDRKCYYAALEGAMASQMYYKNHLENRASQNSRILNLWGKVFAQIPADDPVYRRSPWWFAFMSNYIQYRQHTSGTFDVAKIRKIHEQGNIHT